MILVLVTFLAGALTILSPCILPVLPFVFARSEQQSFAKNTLPLLIGMALTFALIATLAAVGGGWAVRINSYGRVAALILLAGFGVALLSRRIADAIAKPFVALGNRLLQRAGSGTGSVQSLIIGIATGFLWAPCAGPVLGLILTGAAISGPNTQTTLLLLVYALGAIASLALATFAGKRLFATLKKSFNAGEWVRRGLGIAVIAAVIAIGLGWDTSVLTQLSLSSTNRLEESLLEKLHPEAAASNSNSMMMSGAMTGAMTGAMSADNSMSGNGAMSANTAMSANNAMTGGAMMSSKSAAAGITVEGDLPSLAGANVWINSPALTPESLRGKVVLIDFWTYSCINCLRALPYVKTWAERYRDQGLVVIGVHAPEFAFEKDENNVRRAVKDLGITYPVALDNQYAIWQAFNNKYWPAHYFIDAEGRIRGHHFGEGHYDESEQLIRQLLSEAGANNLPASADTEKNVVTMAKGAQAASDESQVGSPETYIGYDRAENFQSPGGFSRNAVKSYSAPKNFLLNHWALSGSWAVDEQHAASTSSDGKIIYRFHARDLHLVLGPNADGKPVRFRVTLDGEAPAKNHGVDIDAEGNGVIREQRLYQLIRQTGDIRDRTFTIEFLDAGAQAYAFTFG